MSDHPIFIESIRLIRELLAQRAAADPALAAHLAGLSLLERDVLERCIHSGGDVSIAADLRFTPSAQGSAARSSGEPERRAGSAAAIPATATGAMDAAVSLDAADAAPGDGLSLADPAWASACVQGLSALCAGAPILTDTAMAAAAVTPMARRTLGTAVHNLLDWAPAHAPQGSTRTAAAVEPAWRALTACGAAPVLLIGSAPTALEALLDLVAAGASAPALIIGMPVGFVGVAESKRRLETSRLAQIRLEGSRGGAGLAAAAVNALLRRAALDQATLSG